MLNSKLLGFGLKQTGIPIPCIKASSSLMPPCVVGELPSWGSVTGAMHCAAHGSQAHVGSPDKL
jgi:hypothetical protein